MHPNPEILALLALGENAGTADERRHIDSCPECAEEVADLSRLAAVGRSTTKDQSLATPSPAVWERVRAELGLTSNVETTDRQATTPLDERTRTGDDGEEDRLTAGSGDRPEPERQRAGGHWAGEAFSR
jgi:hypothetical protein